MRAELQRYGVTVVALSKDSVEDAARYKARDGLELTLLCDPGLEVIRQYGVEHHKAVEASGRSFRIAGNSLGLIPSIKSMAIPTTLLVDEGGRIRWIDQADDYRLRSSEARVMAAVERAFGEDPGASDRG